MAKEKKEEEEEKKKNGWYPQPNRPPSDGERNRTAKTTRTQTNQHIGTEVELRTDRIEPTHKATHHQQPKSNRTNKQASHHHHHRNRNRNFSPSPRSPPIRPASTTNPTPPPPLLQGTFETVRHQHNTPASSCITTSHETHSFFNGFFCISLFPSSSFVRCVGTFVFL